MATNNAEQEQQQQTTFMKWNTKPQEDYRLQFYNYFSDFVGPEVNIKFYNKMNTTHIPKLSHYLRFNAVLYPEEMIANKNSNYNTMMSDPMDAQIITKPYTGRYSLQPDYHFFRR